MFRLKIDKIYVNLTVPVAGQFDAVLECGVKSPELLVISVGVGDDLFDQSVQIFHCHAVDSFLHRSVRSLFYRGSDFANGQEHSDGLGSIAEGATGQIDWFEAQG